MYGRLLHDLLGSAHAHIQLVRLAVFALYLKFGQVVFMQEFRESLNEIHICVGVLFSHAILDRFGACLLQAFYIQRLYATGEGVKSESFHIVGSGAFGPNVLGRYEPSGNFTDLVRQARRIRSRYFVWARYVLHKKFTS